MSDNSTTTDSGPCVIEANPDVTGIGIRISIYILVLGGRILTFLIEASASHGNDKTAKENAKDFRAAVESALTLQGLALLCTAIYQTATSQLSLFHAICCIHILALLGVTIISRNTYRGHGPWRTYANIIISVLAICAFVAFESYIWVKAPTFGSQPDCNASTRYVVFGVQIPATSDVFRYIVIASMAIIPAGFILVITCMAPCFLGIWWLKRKIPGDVNVWQTEQTVTLEDNSPWKKLANVVGMTGFSIYAIVSLEQTISVNNVGDEEKQWGFGQVLALFLLLGVVNELFNLGLAKIDRKRERKDVTHPTEEAEEMMAMNRYSRA